MPHRAPPCALRLEFVALALAVVAMFPADALAYLDPGSGSMLWQTALTLLLGAGVAVRSLRHKLWALLTRARPMGREAEKDRDGSAR